MRRAALAFVLTGCAAPVVTPARPHFEAAQRGVFQDPLPIVETPEDDLLPALTPRGDRIAYVARSAGNLDIYVRALAGGGATRLTTHSTEDTDPAFSPDGKRIAWVSQAEDVKGDVWIMDADGDGKQRLTERDTADRAPAWSADGAAIYFGALAAGSLVERIDRLELGTGLRHTVVPRGWDPAPSPDGGVLFYVAHDDARRPRLFALRLADGQVAAITDGAYVEGMPRVASVAAGVEVVFTRFVDDENGDGRADADDPPSLWAVSFDNAVFEGRAPPPPRPLTAGAGEIFASTTGDWLVYTAAGYADLDVYALPTQGMIVPRAAADAVLEAARATDEPAYKRLALRYLVATAPTFEAAARYELARDLAERDKLSDAIAELERVVTSAPADLAGIARLEIERLRLLLRLGGRLAVREDTERRFVEHQLQVVAALGAQQPDNPTLQTRAQSITAEALYALGERQRAVDSFERLASATDVTAEDAARALDRLGEGYLQLGMDEAVVRVSAALLTRFQGEHYYARRAAQRWIAVASGSAGVPPLAALEDIMRRHAGLTSVAAQAALAMARLQHAAGLTDVAVDGWRAIVAQYSGERAVVAEALTQLGAEYERRGDTDHALDVYERIIAEVLDRARRIHARRGIARIAMATAVEEERRGALDKARRSYERLLRNDRELVTAHRRYIALSAALGELAPVLSRYRNEAHAAPRDKIIRYAYGLALTFAQPLALDDAEAEIEAALEIDPRFAAAHLTRGWLRERREAEEARAGWLEAAEASYETARGLIDAALEPELWAAAHINKGNVLFALGKSDLAFGAYLTRELSSAPHDSALGELLFRESFARVALRQDALDVAIDMAKIAQAMARRLRGEPRRAATAGLLAAIYLQAGNNEDAWSWYDEAQRLYAARRDWTRVVPLLRGRALAEQALGRNDDALTTLTQIIDIIGKGEGPPEPERSLFITEIPSDPKAATRAVYGFSASQEEELARMVAARILRAHGDLDKARALDGRRLELLRAAREDAVIGPRLALELTVALNDSGLLAAQAGLLDEATARFREALTIARDSGIWDHAATLLDSLQQLWARRGQRLPRDIDAVTVATEGLAKAPGTSAARRLARFMAIENLTQAAAVPKMDEGEASEVLPKLLGALDDAVRSGDAALTHARDSGDATLIARLEAYVGSAPASAAPITVASSWRQAFDASLAAPTGFDAATLEQAIRAYETEPVPADAPERGAFLDAAAVHLVASDPARAWRLLERDRLLDLQPEPRRVRGEPTSSAWALLRDVRADATRYASLLAKGTGLLRAIEAQPATLAQVQAVLGADVLLQVFAPARHRWHWFVINAAGVRHVTTEPAKPPALPAEVVHLLPAAATRTLYVDAGELLTVPAWSLLQAGQRLGDRSEVSEVLSATYLVATAEQRNLARQSALAFGATADDAASDVVRPEAASAAALEKNGTGRRLIHFAVPTTITASAGLRAGRAQVTFASRGPTPLDLDTLAAMPLRSAVALVSLTAADVRAQRAITQALLLAGVPTVIIGNYRGAQTELRHGLARALLSERAAAHFATLMRNDDAAANLRLFGDPGANEAERIKFGVDELLRLARIGGEAFKSAQAGRASWREAKEPFTALLDIITYLREPQVNVRLTESTDEKLRKIGQSLANLEAINRGNLAKIHLALDEVDAAARLQELVVQFYESTGKAKEVQQNTLALGKTLSHGKRPREAAVVFQRCSALARAAGDALADADCQSRLASELRASFDLDGAIRAFESAIVTYAQAASQNELYPRRYLGFLYESSLNNYDKALEQFQAALTVAVRHNLDVLTPSLMLDVARIHRLRGDYERALREVQSADERTMPTSLQAKAEAALEAAKIYWYRGNYRRAVERQLTALDLARRAGNSFLVIQAMSLAGLIALNQGELGRAERAIIEALDLARITRRTGEEAAQLNNLGIVLREAGRLDDAVARFREALALDEAQGSVEGRAYDLRNLAVALARQNKPDEALTSLEQALQASRAIGNRYNELQCLFARGEVLETSDAAEARAMYDAASKLARIISVPEVEWRSLWGIGRLVEAGGNTAAARRWFEQALAVAERLGRGRSESVSGRGRDDLYDDALRLAVAAGDVVAAYAYTERARARGMLDVLATRVLELPNDEARALLEQELQAREAYLAAERELSDGLPDAPPRFEARRAAHRRAKDALVARFPRLARLFLIDPMPLAQLQAALPPQALVLSYYVGNRDTTVLLIAPDAVSVRRLPVGKRELTETVQGLRQAMAAFAPVDATLDKLAAALLDDTTRASLGRAQVLSVLKHGPLYHVPFAALPLGDAPLIARLALAEAPSASVLADVLRESRAPRPTRIAALAPANDLPFARLEALAIAANDAVLGAEASEARLRDTNADALDVAAHAELDPLDPLVSALQLTASGADDGRLEIREVFGLTRLPALVTLSACASAGSDVQGDEWLTLGHAFLAAGSRAVVASQTRVSDLAAAVLIKRFYRGATKLPTAEALRQAALWTRQRFAHPGHWANFVLLGDFR